MKIVNVEVFHCQVSHKYPAMPKFEPVFIRINTDEGISGVGEVGLAYGSGALAGVGIVQDLARNVIGMDPTRVEAIWEKLFRNTFWGCGGGPVIYAGMSAIDIACWDIRGKFFNAPVYALLGGKTNETLRCYASQLQFNWGKTHKWLNTPEEYAEATKNAMDEGYDCIKVDPLMVDETGKRNPKQSSYGILPYQDVELAFDRVAGMREVGGPALDIIIELHSFLGCTAAIQLAERLKPLRIYYYEEPMHSLHVENMALIARTIGIPVATGERVYTRWGYRPFLEKQALAVVQPDACLAGGISETKKICDAANTYDATVQVHVCGGPVSTAAALHIEAVIPNFLIHEHHTYALKDHMIELCKYDYQPVNGYYSVPDLPGLGQELNDKIVKEYLVTTVK
jgi:L-alanine-DL-glutamate epimerase-like enolase superfamily enzyme